jgi:predicted MPP superfamily phosphohydrolase
MSTDAPYSCFVLYGQHDTEHTRMRMYRCRKIKLRLFQELRDGVSICTVTVGRTIAMQHVLYKGADDLRLILERVPDIRIALKLDKTGRSISKTFGW